MFSFRKRDEVSFLHCDGFDERVRHGFSTRKGGVSLGVYESLNLGFFSDDEQKFVGENWCRFLNAVGLKDVPVTYQHQVHGVKARRAKAKGAFHEMGDGDALWTNESGLALAIVTADCAPVFLYGRSEKPFVAAIHAGWRGLADGIITKTVTEICAHHCFDMDEVTVAAGPHIGPCCYEVGIDTAQKLEKRGGKGAIVTKSTVEGKLYANLAHLVRKECLSLGIPELQILISDMCTCCHGDNFYSYRRSQARERGRMGNVIALASNGY